MTKKLNLNNFYVMNGNYRVKLIQKKIYSADYKHKYLITMLLLAGKVISKSVIEI